ncbi:MAG: hypothetical protein LW847_10995 [Burkholderiales bacterium]|nr:hypothetical protein [Burkholderiales bacterium]
MLDRLRCAAALAAALALSNGAAAQESTSSWWSRALTAINDTTPAGLKPVDQRSSGWSWFTDQWESGKALIAKGQANLLLPAITTHPAGTYDNYYRQNGYPYGAGIGSYFIDDRDNERIVYAMAFSDSHYNIEPLAGYAWVARWPIFGSRLKAGIGYTAFLTARNDTLWLPVPGVLPLISIGTDEASVYVSHVVTQNVTFIFARISPEAFGSGLSPGAADGTDRRRNLLFAGYGYVNADASGVDNASVNNGAGPVLGYRRYLGDNFALEFSAERSEHDLYLPGAGSGSFRREAYSLAGQYHFPVARRVQLFAGIGVAYERVTQQQFDNASLSDSWGPVVQGGATVDLTSVLSLTGGIRTGFPRYQTTINGQAGASVLIAPVTFSLALAARF